VTGVISSGLEASALRRELGARLLVVTPGIRPCRIELTNDQKRTSTVARAFANGADYIVVGRPIRDAPDPRAAAQAIQATMPRNFPPDIGRSYPGGCLRRGGSEGKFALALAPHAAPGAITMLGYSACLGIRYSEVCQRTYMPRKTWRTSRSFFNTHRVIRSRISDAKTPQTSPLLSR